MALYNELFLKSTQGSTSVEKLVNDGVFHSFHTYFQYGKNFDPNARTLTKLESNEIFNDFAISREPFDEIDSNFFILKLWTRK